MEGMRAYQTYLALKLHFTSDYDYFKYAGKTRTISESALQARKDYHQFRRIERRYKDNLIEFIVSNIIQNNAKWAGDLVTTQSEKNYVEWRKRNQSFAYIFRQDLEKLIEDKDALFRVENGGHPKLLKYYLGKKIMIETVVAMNDVLNFMPHWNKNITDTIIWTDVSRLLEKYRPFVKCDKQQIKTIMKEIFL